MRVLPLFLLTIACSSSPALERGPLAGARPQPVAALGADGMAQVEANWKERLEQPFVYVEQRGDYRNLGAAMQRLLAEVQALGLHDVGAPFALFFDDPGKTQVAELRARVCCPVADRPSRLGELQFDVLPRAMVVYARVEGDHPTVARAYPALFSFLHELGWQQGGPVREVYLMDASAAGSAGLLTEVQIPWAARGE